MVCTVLDISKSKRTDRQTHILKFLRLFRMVCTVLDISKSKHTDIQTDTSSNFYASFERCAQFWKFPSRNIQTDRQTHPQIFTPLLNGVHSSGHFQVETYRQTDRHILKFLRLFRMVCTVLDIPSQNIQTDRQTHPKIFTPLLNGVHSSGHFQVKTYRQTDTSSNLYTSFEWCEQYTLPQYLQPSKIARILSISATFGGIFGLCMGGSVMSLFEIFYRLLLVMIAMIKTLMNRHIQQPHDNIVMPSNIKTFTPHNMELFHRMRHENIS